MRKLWIILCLVLCATPGWATTYYVCDSGTGCCGQGSNTLSVSGFGSANFEPNDEIYICGTVATSGTSTSSLQLTAEDSGSSGSPVVIRGDYPGYQGTISISSASASYGIDVNDADYIKISYGIIFDGNNVTAYSNYGVCSSVDECPSNIEIDNCQFINFLGGGGGNPEGIHLLGSNDDLGCFTENNSIHHNTFTNIGAYGDTGSAAIELKYAKSSSIYSNTITGNGSTYGLDGITINNGDTTTATRGGSGFLIYDNTCYGMDENCVDLKHVHEVDGEGRTYIYNNDLSGSVNETLIMIHFGTNGVDIHHNRLYNAYGGIDLSTYYVCCGYDGDIVIYSNLFYGMRLSAYHDNVGNGYNKILNNTFYNCGSESPAGSYWGLWVYASNFTIENNIFKDLSTNVTNYRELVFINETATNGSLDYNIYDKYGSGTIVVRCQTTGFPDCVTDCAGEYCTMAELQSMGWETHNTCTDDCAQQDPLFVNAVGANFQLQPTSPAADAGTDNGISGWTDFLGRPRVGSFPVGAYELYYAVGAYNVNGANITYDANGATAK